MKSPRSSPWSVALAVFLPLAGGCVQEAASVPEQPAIAISTAATSGPPAPAVVGVPVTDTNLVAENASLTNETPQLDLEKAATTLVAARTLPPGIKPNAPVAEIIKLADSGVDEGVMLAFVTNSSAIFNLGAEEIIYLNDIGISSAVVTGMIQHDQALKGAANATAVAAQAVAAAPETPTQQAVAAVAPNPADMAPQPVAPQGAEAQSYPAPPATAPTQDTFYETLSPYGNWIDVQGYGRVWQPTVVVANPGWRPYCDNGRWVYTDVGWYWYSDYSWGWAPFHYGRWFRHHHWGWCWSPDVVWGPSWVTWRYTDGYCGWAPLPPAACYRPGYGFTYYGASVGVGFSFGIAWSSYSFVGWNHFHHHHVYKHCVPHDHARRIHDQSVAVTRISGNRNNVANHGIPPERVAAAGGTPIRKVTVREARGSEALRVRGERLSADGRSLVVHRPQIPEAVRTPAGRVERASLTGTEANRAATRFAAPPVARDTAPAAPDNTGSSPAIRSPGTVSGIGGAARSPRGTVPRPQSAPNRLVNTPDDTSSQVSSQSETARSTPTSRPTVPTSAPVARSPQTAPAGNAQDPAASRPAPVFRSAPVSRPTQTASSEASQRPSEVPRTPVARPNPVARVTAPPAVPEREVPTGSWQGQRQAAPSQNPFATPARPGVAPTQREARTPSYQVPATEVPRFAPAPRQQAPAFQAPAGRQAMPETPRFNPAPVQRESRVPTVEVPRYSAPAPAQRSAPSFEAPRSAPAQRAPSFEAPRSAPVSRPSPPASVQSGRSAQGRGNPR